MKALLADYAWIEAKLIAAEPLLRMKSISTTPRRRIGWPLWCERQIEAANVVLMVCTETYHRRVSGDEEQGKAYRATQISYWSWLTDKMAGLMQTVKARSAKDTLRDIHIFVLIQMSGADDGATRSAAVARGRTSGSSTFQVETKRSARGAAIR